MQISAPNAMEFTGAALFALAVIHTFCINKFKEWAHLYPQGSLRENFIHFLSETEIIFGMWAALLFVLIVLIERDVKAATDYIDALDFTEPKFVLVVMVIAASRPVVVLAEQVIHWASRCLPLSPSAAFYFVALGIGPILGSLITEPAAMTLLALILKDRLFEQGVSKKFAYATLGLLFVNISVGGVLTHFAAPPVLMVAGKWNWGLSYMFLHFGWRGALTCLTGAALTLFFFRKEVLKIAARPGSGAMVPAWLTICHLLLLALTVVFAHHANVFFGVFMIFLGLTVATQEYQEPLKLREGLLVGFFLAGLVTLANLQTFWLKPLLASLKSNQLYFGATALTAITDNAALTYLGSLFPNLPENMKYALVAGAVTGGGLTVIANAPNPAGVGILQSSRFFSENGLSPVKLFAGALGPTLIAIVFFWLI